MRLHTALTAWRDTVRFKSLKDGSSMTEPATEDPITHPEEIRTL